MTAITEDAVFYALQPWLGVPLLTRSPALVRDVAAHLNRYFSEEALPLDDLRAQCESLLFNSIYTATNGSMVASTPDGRPVSIRTQYLPSMTEDVIGLILCQLPINEQSFELLNAYAMRHTSLPVLRRLYLEFGAYMPPMNRETILRIAGENFGSEAIRDWLR